MSGRPEDSIQHIVEIAAAQAPLLRTNHDKTDDLHTLPTGTSLAMSPTQPWRAASPTADVHQAEGQEPPDFFLTAEGLRAWWGEDEAAADNMDGARHHLSPMPQAEPGESSSQRDTKDEDAEDQKTYVTCGGRCLRHSWTLRRAGIANQAILHVVIRRRGGTPKRDPRGGVDAQTTNHPTHGLSAARLAATPPAGRKI